MHDVPRQPAGSLPIGRRLRDWLGFGPPRPESVAEVGPLPRISGLNPGAASGIEHHELTQDRGDGASVTITCIDFSPDSFQVEQVTDLDDFLARHRPEWAVVRWVNIDGLSDMNVLWPAPQKLVQS